jgi:heptosyltransferase-3
MKPVVGLQICSFPTKAHRDWPLESFRAFVTAMLEKSPECGFLILGDDKAREAAIPLVEGFPGRVVVAAGSTTLRQTAALIDRLGLYVGVDTGPTHIAGAVDVPMVAMYHADYPGRNLAPLDRPACVMLEHPLTGKIEPGKASMMDIKVDDVTRAVSTLLT